MTYNYHVPLEKNDVSFFRKITQILQKLSSKPAVLRRVLLGESTVASRIKRLGSLMIVLVTIVQIRRVHVDQTWGASMIGQRNLESPIIG